MISDINKATTLVFFTFYFLFFIFSIYFNIIFKILVIQLVILISFLFSFIFSIIITYIFNIYLYKKLKNEELNINAYLKLIILDFSLINSLFTSISDKCLNFIESISNYDYPISKIFKSIIRKIQFGKNPENELKNLNIISKNFQSFLNDLVSNNFEDINLVKINEYSYSEDLFETFIRSIESKLSIIFFIGLFFPIGSIFLIILQEIKPLSLIIIIPLYFFIIRYLSSKFLNEDIKLLGILNFESKNKRIEFNNFLLFLKSFAIMLSRKTSPENALYFAYKKTPKSFQKKMEHPVSLLIKNSISLKEMLDLFFFNLKSQRCKLILNVVKKMIHEDTYHTANKIWDLLKIISIHQKLEKRKRIIIKGEKFKSLIFVFLLPFILGIISGVFPTFFYYINLLNNPEFITTIPFYNNFDLFDLILIFGSFLLSNIISVYYFSKIISIESKKIIVFTSNLIFVLIFLIILSISLNSVYLLNFN